MISSWYCIRDTAPLRFLECSSAQMLPKNTASHTHTHTHACGIQIWPRWAECVSNARLSELSDVSVCRAELFSGTWCQSANDDLCLSSSPPVALINRDEVCIVIFSARGCPSACLCGDECAGEGRSLCLGWTRWSWGRMLDTAGVALHHQS